MSQARIVLSVLAAIQLTACGGGGGGGSNTPTPPPQGTTAPTVTLTADRQSALTGQPVALSWTSTNASSCSASTGWSGSKAVTGTESVASVAGSSTYTITCTNAAGSANSSVTVSATSPTVSGVLLAPDGATPIAGATVYAATQPASSIGKLRANRQSAPGDSECAAPSAANSGSACTGADGSFSFTVGSVSGNSIPLVFEKGMFRMTQTVTAAETMALGNVQLPKEAAEGAPRIAVVTGAFDRIEVILAKLGLATINAGEIDYATAAFTMFDGNQIGEFDDVSDLFAINAATNMPRIAEFDIVFVNCGADTTVLETNENLATLRTYVQNGGVLYATDWAYDFVEQSIPEYLRFVGESDANPAQPHSPGGAQIGPSDIAISATVRDPLLAAWLDGVSCNGDEPCRGGGGTVHIEGFLDGWAVMEGAHSALASVVSVHVSGIIPGVGSPDQERPLSVAFPFGEGQVIYSSYHTVHDSETGTSFYPQERVLQYLVFEAGE